jgi:Outer membrane protein beta-barrel domain
VEEIADASATVRPYDEQKDGSSKVTEVNDLQGSSEVGKEQDQSTVNANKETDDTRYSVSERAVKREEPVTRSVPVSEVDQPHVQEPVSGRRPEETSSSIAGKHHPPGDGDEAGKSGTGNEGNVYINRDAGDSSEGIARSGKSSDPSHYRGLNSSVVLNHAEVDADSIIHPIRLPLLDSASAETVVASDRAMPLHQWFVKLPVSPDFSSIDYNKVGKAGVNIGLMVEYTLGRRFSVSSGAIWSKKLYDQKNPDKTYTAGNWSTRPIKMNGDCRVLDLPLNITYYIVPERNTSLFITVGSSSYLMLKESYTYTIRKNQDEYEWEQNFSNKNNEWFSMLNVSIGIQQRIGKRLYAQAEPFIKAPISGVGEGKVNLMSTGVFFSLKYALNLIN